MIGPVGTKYDKEHNPYGIAEMINNKRSYLSSLNEDPLPEHRTCMSLAFYYVG